MRDTGHAAVEFALGVGLLLLPVALVIASFGPWSERRVLAESAAAEAARVAVVELDHGGGAEAVRQAVASHGLSEDLVRLGWCGSPPGPIAAPTGSCPFSRGSTVSAVVEVWVPVFHTAWGDVGGLWVSAAHLEPVDLFRSLP